MAVFRIDPSPETTVNVFSSAHDPLLVIDPGDAIVTLDAAWYLERHACPGRQRHLGDSRAAAVGCADVTGR